MQMVTFFPPLVLLVLIGNSYWPLQTELQTTEVATRHDDIEARDESYTATTGHELETFPDGGWRAWSVVVGVFLSQFCTFGYTNSYGVYNDFYVREYLGKTSTSSQISWIGSVQLWLVLSSGIFSGRAFDAGYFYPIMIAGAALFLFCIFMISISQPEQYYQLFLAQGLGMGIAVGAMYIPSLGIIAHYFQKRRSLALGLATTGSGVGGAVFPIILNKWFHGSLGFHSGVKASGGLTGGLLIIALILMKPRYPPNPKKAISTFQSFRTFLRDYTYVLMIIGMGTILAGLYYPIFFVQLNAIKNGINPTLAFYTITILNGASVVGRVIPNLFVHKTGPFNMIIPCIFISALLVFCTLAVDNAPGTIIFAILYGFFSGSYISLLAPVIASTATKDSEIGARLGVCFTFTGLGGLVGTPIAGALLTSSFIWWRPILFSGLCVSFGGVCFVISRFVRAHRQGTQWL
ncbi:major facilitator superfamily domain-containing protein [Panaeolus papilionaceus]|nr:major facilitator superfamily domain-containing protein [Panaeolus papilionaceus]